MSEDSQSTLKGVLIIIASAALFSLMGLGVRFSKESYRPDVLLFYRSCIQMLILLPWLGSYLKGREPLSKRVRIHFVRGFFGIFAVFFFYLALQQNPLALTNLLTMTQVFWAALMSWIFLRETVSFRQISAALLTCLGLGYSLLDSQSGGGWHWNLVGVLSALLCAVFSATALTAVRSMRKNTGAREIVFFFGLCGVVMSGPTFFLHLQWPSSLHEWGLVLWVGLCGSLAQILMTLGYRYTQTMIGALALSAQLPFNTVLGYFFLDEQPPAHFLLGAIIAFTGITWLVIESRRRHKSLV